MWTYRLEAVVRMRAEGIDVTRWAGDGTLRTRDNITGHDVVREGGSPIQDYREVTEPLLGFRRAVRRGNLRGVRIDGIRGASSFEGVVDGMTVDLLADGLPLRVATDGTTWTFAYRERLAFMEDQPS